MKPLCMKRILMLLTLLAEAWNASAKVTLPEQICDNMVLQQNASVRLWGWAGPHAAGRGECAGASCGCMPIPMSVSDSYLMDYGARNANP